MSSRVASEILSHKEFRESTPWSVSREVLDSGMSDGVELLHVDNGQMRFVVIPTRGMGIFRAETDQLAMGWDSPVKQIIHPKYIHLENRGGLGWLAGFNELFVRCGAEYFGAPGNDNGQFLPLHGRVANLPATEVHVEYAQETEEIKIRGKIEEVSFKFQQLEIWCEISTSIGSSQFKVRDRLVNRSAYPQEYQMLYHINFGPPILEENAQFVGPVKTIAPLDSYAMQDLGTYQYYLGPTPNYGEQVYGMELHSDHKNRTEVLLKNSIGNLGVGLRYSTDTLPFFTLWKNTDSLEDGYVTGLEPGTAYPYNRAVSRQLGHVSKLSPGGFVEFELEIEAVCGEEAVEATSERIRALSRNRPIEWSETLANGEKPVR